MQYILLNSSKSLNEVIKTTEDIDDVLNNLSNCTHVIRKFRDGSTQISTTDELLDDLLCEQQVYAVMMLCMLSPIRKFKFIAKNDCLEHEQDIDKKDAKEIWVEICKNIVNWHATNTKKDLEYFVYSYTGEECDKHKALCFPLSMSHKILEQMSITKLNSILDIK